MYFKIAKDGMYKEPVINYGKLIDRLTKGASPERFNHAELLDVKQFSVIVL